MAESVNDKLKRVRKPRVHITYEVETEGAVAQKELPFVMGVMGEFTGNASAPQKALKDRKFVQIDRDNFNDVMSRLGPAMNAKVENTLTGEGEIAVNLKFNSMDDFDPAKIVEQIEPLKKLLETRNKLKDLLTKADNSDNLQDLLEQILQNEADVKKLASDLGVSGEQSK
ncbi:MAG: type VI secretion system contractile sheath small subunit [Gemmataceae bacterium]|nr:type VI secretion system contractile sheath small subunit [Gemmataceae bacterium]